MRRWFFYTGDDLLRHKIRRLRHIETVCLRDLDNVRQYRSSYKYALIFSIFFEGESEVVATTGFHCFAFAAGFRFAETNKRNRLHLATAVVYTGRQSDTYQKVKCD